ncbi:pilus (MSHA type) biogenesis protein MshL [Helicobacter canis]|uniref:pilus (MSHA type) biogenesis protein MshL n=1 Tax=Helicobacter canis TaxID=29419 RepID=UPI0026EB874F|nr:pilus (MSHA type) biogenesis protein MshL [Helicobacter canis]
MIALESATHLLKPKFYPPNPARQIPHQILAILLVCTLLLSITQADECANRSFTLQSKPNLSPKLLLEEIALECKLSLILENNAQNALDKTKVSFSFHKAKIQEILSTIAKASDTHYSLEQGLIRFSHLRTQTFHINYIATARVGSSNTDVVYGQESQAQSLTPHTSYHQPYATNPLGDDIQTKALTQGTQSPVFGKSGTKIYSIDELNFWGDLENELIAIIYQESDSYNPKHPRIIINKGAGLITINATPRQLERAQAYITALQSRLREQVQIDVQIFNVDHSNINTIGVNWGKLFELGLNTQSPQPPLLSTTPSGLNYGVYVFSQDLSIGQIVQFLQEYGKTKSVSNPKIITLNNQPAIISVGNVLRYSQSLIYQTSTNSSTIQNTGYQYPSVFSGVLLDVTPSIYGQEIILKINPSITAAKDPSIENQPQALNAPPNLSTNQLSSIVRIQNGQRVILGGLISETDSTQTKKLPLLGSIPLLKYLFSYKKSIKQKREMVIIITPTIIDNQSTPYTINEA